MIHLLNDLGIYKASLKRKLLRDFGDRFRDGDSHALQAYALLERNGQSYTPDECLILSCYLSSSHDGCVIDNPDEYSHVEVWQSERNERRVEEVTNRIAELSARVTS